MIKAFINKPFVLQNSKGEFDELQYSKMNKMMKLFENQQFSLDAAMSTYVPELAKTAYGDATLRHVLDMTIGVRYSEVYVDPDAEVWAYSRAGGLAPLPDDYTGPRTIFDFLLALEKEGEHGQAFAYKTCNTEVLSWVIQRITGQPIAEMISERIWQRLGAEEDGDLYVDPMGTAMAGGGLSVTLRDLTRFGEMMRLRGQFNGQQIVPEAVVKDIETGADQGHFAKAGVHCHNARSRKEQGVAIWQRMSDELCAYTATCTSLVIDDHWLLKTLRQLWNQYACHGVCRPTGCERNDKVHGLVGVLGTVLCKTQADAY
jgi:hypothetical protein